MPDYYHVLGVERSASSDAIKKAYRKLAHRYHPDKNPGDKKSEESFKEVTRAYEILSDPDKRRSYDQWGDNPQFAMGDSPMDMGGFSKNMGDVFSDIFADLLGKRKNKPSKQRGRDRKYDLQIDFKTAVFGGERTIEIPRQLRCDTCTGTGAKPGSAPQFCHACGGTGELQAQQGLFSSNKTCGYCKGQGRIISQACVTCTGLGFTEKKISVKIKIPSGTEDGLVLRYAGEGESGKNGGGNGDLRVELKVKSHAVFKQKGRDIYCELPVRFSLATLGGMADVPTLDGKVRMSIPEGTQSGQVFRLRGKGLAVAGGERGDQHVTIVIAMPHAINQEQRNLLQQFQQTENQEQYLDIEKYWQNID